MKQWAWIIGQCGKCNGQSQMPVADDLNEDCNLFDELKILREEGGHCSCGGKIIYKPVQSS